MRFIRFYNQNRKSIWMSILVSLMLMLLIQTLNNFAKEKRKSSSTSATTYSAINEKKNYAVITQDTVDENKGLYITQTIENFLTYCNLGETEKAYNMLSQDCKNYLYKTQKEFEEKYYNNYFKTKRTYQYQAWIIEANKYVYRIELGDDLLATGNINSKKIEDFFTVTYQEGTYKLNINRYIGHEEINKETKQNNLKIKILSKDVFLEEERYNFRIENYSKNTILLDNKKNNQSVLLKEDDNLQYVAQMHEFIEQDLIIYPRIPKEITMKFSRGYNQSNVETTIEFKNIILNYKTNSEEKITIII